jgi:hypothetical protein
MPVISRKKVFKVTVIPDVGDPFTACALNSSLPRGLHRAAITLNREQVTFVYELAAVTSGSPHLPPINELATDIARQAQVIFEPKAILGVALVMHDSGVRYDAIPIMTADESEDLQDKADMFMGERGLIMPDRNKRWFVFLNPSKDGAEHKKHLVWARLAFS